MAKQLDLFAPTVLEVPFRFDPAAKSENNLRRRFQRGTHFHVALTDADYQEPEGNPLSTPCRGGAWADPTECLTHEGARINPRTGLCESVSLEEGF
jgi:hypothetical protein